MNDKLSPFLCGFRKQYSTQHALIRMLEQWKHCLDYSGVVMAVLMDLSKAYDCIPHDLLRQDLFDLRAGNSNLAKSLTEKSNHAMYQDENPHRCLLSLQN